MTLTPPAEVELRKIIQTGRSVIVVGSGVSVAASYDKEKGGAHPQASWAGLLKNGINWLKDHHLMAPNLADAHLLLLENNPQTHSFISAAESIVKGMGGDGSIHFSKWLKDTVGSIEPSSPELLGALHALRKCGKGHLLSTTNYDELLLTGDEHLNPVTWQESDKLIRTARDWNTQNILFLHGFWRKPHSIVLDWKSYDRIARDENYRDDLTAFWKTHTWIYVGCGTSGLSDPDFGLLLERYGERASQAGHWDYCLVRGKEQRLAFQAYFDTRRYNIKAVSYGENYRDLQCFLNNLLPEPLQLPVVKETKKPVKPSRSRQSPIPWPPELYAKPDYIGSHQFVGRRAELTTLSDWADPSDPTNLLLFEAIGGNGKSMLTWEWTLNYAPLVRKDWAGTFWYSFNESGMYMESFCRHALAYMTEKPVDRIKYSMSEMIDKLIDLLQVRPWLFILDGLERVLVDYHDAETAKAIEEESSLLRNPLSSRDPRDAIRDEDHDLLKALSTSSPSKVLVTTRLTPRILLNNAGQSIPGVKRMALDGLRPADAEGLLRSCDVQGDSSKIRSYLRKNCDNHPLVIGILAGLINEPGPHRGNFDEWSMAPEGGASLNLASLNLNMRRNHILTTAIDSLDKESLQLLSTLAMITDAVDYQTLIVFNPHKKPDENDDDRSAARKLAETVQDLERRGLLQYDGMERQYDLHAVVRGVTAGRLNQEEKERYGQQVIDYFSAKQQRPYQEAKTLKDVSAGLHVVRTLLAIGQVQKAANAYSGPLAEAMDYNLEAHVEKIALVRHFFPDGWETLPKNLDTQMAAYLLNNAANSLMRLGDHKATIGAYSAVLQACLEMGQWDWIGSVVLSNISISLKRQNLVASSYRIKQLSERLAEAQGESQDIFSAKQLIYGDQLSFGQWDIANQTWNQLNRMGRNWPRHIYLQGELELLYCHGQFWQGTLEEKQIQAAYELCKADNNRHSLRRVHLLKGYWYLELKDYQAAITSFSQAATMSRESGIADADSETGLAFAKALQGNLKGEKLREEALRLSKLSDPEHELLAELWLMVDDRDQAEKHAKTALTFAGADGEPYVHRYALDRAKSLLERLEIPLIDLPKYDPKKDQTFPWESEVEAAIKKFAQRKSNKRDDAGNDA